jgi:HPP family/Inner membrane component of T3SS, cytoplasmic domain
MTMYDDRSSPVERSRGQQAPAGVAGTSRPLAGTLQVLDGPDRGQMWRLSPGAYVLGRAPDADLPVTDRGVSRRHCLVVVAGHTRGQPGTVTVEDLGSSNGILVDGAWARQPTALRPGATIVVGGTTLSWAPYGWRPPASSAPAPGSPTVAGAEPSVRPLQQMPVHPPAPPRLPAAAPPRVQVPAPAPVPMSAGVPASVARTQAHPGAPAVAPEPDTERLSLPRKIRWPQSAAPARPKSMSTALSTLTSLGALGTLAVVGMLTDLPLLIPPLAASMALIAAGTALPLAQPRNVIGGQVVSALVGFAVVALIGPGGWAAALAGAVALGAMLLLRVSHSPAAATAVIVGATAPSAPRFLELLILAVVILVVFGIVGARLDGKKYPVYWW